MIKPIKNILLCSVIIFSATVSAKVPIADTLLGQVIDKTLLVAGKSSIPQFKQYKLVNDPKGVARVKKILSNIKTFSGHKFRYSDPEIRINVGKESEPNALSLGPAIYITKSALDILDDAELTAVMAHEISHSEYGHYLARMVYATGSPVLYLRNLIFSDIYLLTTGEADEYMNRILKDGQLEMVREIMENASLAQEMQADCSAANWLERAHRLGWKLSPQDLNRATNAIMGMDIGQIAKYDPTSPVVIRYKAVQSGQYLGSHCPL